MSYTKSIFNRIIGSSHYNIVVAFFNDFHGCGVR